MLMKPSLELVSLRPEQPPNLRTWFTSGCVSLKKSSGKFYYEATLGVDMHCPQLGWLNDEYMKPDGDSRIGVGDDENGWAVDGARQKFWHGDSKDIAWPTPWLGNEIIGL